MVSSLVDWSLSGVCGASARMEPASLPTIQTVGDKEDQMQRTKLGLSLIATLLFSVATTALASAASFLSSAREKLLSTNVATQRFTTEAGNVECTKATITAGESPDAETAEQSATIKYENCTAFGFTSVTISPAEYVFLATGEVRILKLISIVTLACEVSIPAQSVSKVDYATKGKDILLEPLVTGIKYTASGSFCAKAGTFANGTYAGHVEVMTTNGTLSFMTVGEVEPLPNKTVISGLGIMIESKKELPVINWAAENPIMTHGCKGGKVTTSTEGVNSKTGEKEHRESTLTESPAGSQEFVGNIPVMAPVHGKGSLTITVSGCEHASEEIVILIVVYIDPSGKVVDGDHSNAPVAEATVTLLASETESGPFTAVPNGSEVMSPMNRVNPDLTRANGYFGWDVIEGYYEVEATKTGCGTATTPAFHIPPAEENLLIVLHC